MAWEAHSRNPVDWKSALTIQYGATAALAHPEANAIHVKIVLTRGLNFVTVREETPTEHTSSWANRILPGRAPAGRDARMDAQNDHPGHSERHLIDEGLELKTCLDALSTQALFNSHCVHELDHLAFRTITNSVKDSTDDLNTSGTCLLHLFAADPENLLLQTASVRCGQEQPFPATVL